MKRKPWSVFNVAVTLVAAMASATYLVYKHPGVPTWQAALLGALGGIIWSICFLAAFQWIADRGYFEFFMRRRSSE